MNRSEKKLKAIPKVWKGANRVSELNLTNNKITNLSGLSKYPNVERLSLDKNCIQSLPSKKSTAMHAKSYLFSICK